MVRGWQVWQLNYYSFDAKTQLNLQCIGLPHLPPDHSGTPAHFHNSPF